ncbi:HNH endonuclease signature motif containing protein [Geodermatophilus aquaeductus]|uniref:HNH endonuclease signature motif containing protein n=1 Tax=Geodermatophilus aquaeductus TaxID=1564161 RepID=UPI001FEC2FE0|nr:HNH endonuclease signature motif containing protein [Geodermatophilus aquaeductus]
MTGSSTAVLDPPATTPPGVGWASGPLAEVQAASREISRQTALRYRAIAAFAATRPASADRAPGEPGTMSAERWAARADVLRPVSEWATQELVIALDVTSQRAEDELERALLLDQRLPLVLDALEAGVLHPGHLWCLLEHVAPIGDDALRTRIQAELLDWMGARHRVTTPAQLGDRVRRVVARHNARDAARHLTDAIRRRGVTARPDRCEGMSVVSALLTTPEAAALVAALGAYADALPADGRSRGQTMADCLLDLVLRPSETDLPPVQVVLSVIAPLGALLGGDQPCEIDGQVVPAETVRALLAALTGHPLVTTTAPAYDDATEDATTDAAATDEDAAGSIPDGAVLTEDEHFARWAEDLERRILAGEFDDRPAPCFPDEPLPDPGARDPGASPGPDSSPPPHPAGPPDGWWARADRAIEDAGDAVLAAQQALGRAHRLVATAARADAADETAWAHSAAGRVTAAPDALTALGAVTDEARQALADLLATTGGGGLADRPRLVLTDALTGALLGLTDLPELRRIGTCGRPACRRRPEHCDHDLTGRPGLRPPAESPGYRPGAALDRHVRARDRRCRFPGCRRRVPRTGELDHAVAWPAGPTSAANLTGYCTGHHRGKHQAPGWRHTLAPNGTLTVTTPSGLTASTEPPPY